MLVAGGEELLVQQVAHGRSVGRWERRQVKGQHSRHSLVETSNAGKEIESKGFFVEL